MAKQRILIVDDEEDICMILSYSLQKAGYEVLVAHSAEEALELLQSPIAYTPSPIDLILLDIMMGEMSGLEMAEKLRSDIGYRVSDIGNRESGIGIPPIIFLTALSDEDTVLQGFKLGADDYISKPFRIAEVLARVVAVLRRSATPKTAVQNSSEVQNSSTIVFEGIVVNKADMSLKVDDKTVVMTRKEIELLCYLLTHRGQILSREHLLKNVWDSNGFVMERTVDVHITHLRKKLGQYGKRIVTKSGYGYMFSV